MRRCMVYLDGMIIYNEWIDMIDMIHRYKLYPLDGIIAVESELVWSQGKWSSIDYGWTLVDQSSPFCSLDLTWSSQNTQG